MKTKTTKPAGKRRTLESHINRSEINRRARLAYLAKHPTPHTPFSTMKVQKPVVEGMKKIKCDNESWGAFFSRIIRKAGFKFDVKF